jgi:hypothetical protein
VSALFDSASRSPNAGFTQRATGYGLAGQTGDDAPVARTARNDARQITVEVPPRRTDLPRNTLPYETGGTELTAAIDYGLAVSSRYPRAWSDVVCRFGVAPRSTAEQRDITWIDRPTWADEISQTGVGDVSGRRPENSSMKVRIPRADPGMDRSGCP